MAVPKGLGKIFAFLRGESAQSASEYAIITGAVVVCLIAAAAGGGASLVQLIARWIERALDRMLIRVAGLGDLFAAAKELWRY